ncbi:hypothetical protein SGLAM104S_07762 [Streptomyces glaucescens]
MPDPSGPGGTGEGGDTGYDDGPVPVVPDRCLGTWEGQGTALDGRLPVGTFRVTVRRTEVGEQLGPVRQTDALGGVCTDVLTLTKTTGQAARRGLRRGRLPPRGMRPGPDDRAADPGGRRPPVRVGEPRLGQARGAALEGRLAGTAGRQPSCRTVW